MKCVPLWCNSVSDVARPRHISSACQRCCCVNYFGDVVWVRCIIALKCATSASGPLHYMKSNRWLSTTCAICWADLSDFRCNNCQRNEGARRKAISSDSDNITHLEAWKTKGIGMRENIKYYTTMERRWRRNKAFTLYRFQLSGVCDTTHGVALLWGLNALPFEIFFQTWCSGVMLPDWSHIEDLAAESEEPARQRQHFIY